MEDPINKTVDPTSVTTTRPTFGAWIKSFAYSVGNFMIRYPLAIAGTILVVAGAVAMLIFGQKIQIGGVLGWLWGHVTHNPDMTVTTPPPARIDPATGKVIEPGQADPNGFTQAQVVVPISNPTIFSDPTTVTVTPPNSAPVTLKLPTGLTSADVKTVIQISPTEFQVANHDSGVDAGSILKDIS